LRGGQSSVKGGRGRRIGEGDEAEGFVTNVSERR